MDKTYDAAIVGAGPLGLEMAAALKIGNIDFIHFDKGQIGETISNFPPETRFFSSSERIGIGGIPLRTIDQQKCSREYYLAYLRMVAEYYHLKIHSFEEVAGIEKHAQGFLIRTKSRGLAREYSARFVILATGGLSRPRKLNVPGEELPGIEEKLGDPHRYFQKKIVIAGGKNSAVEAALRCFHAGAEVSLVVREEKFDPGIIKFWLLPELEGRIKKGQIACYYQSRIIEIHREKIVISGNKEVHYDFVIKAIGYEAEMDLFRQLGVRLSEKGEPSFDPETMQTNVPDVYALGTVSGGTQIKFELYIENTHHHVGRILSSLCQKLSIEEPDVPWIKKHFRRVAPLEE